MGIREAANKNKALTLGVIGVLLAGAVGLAIWTNSSGFPATSTQFFFSDDDGKTYFVDSVNKVPPFDHNGKPASQAMVYRAGNSPPFVGFLQTYKPETAKQISAILNGPITGDTGSRLNDLRADPLVKRPGETTWHSASSPDGAKATTIQPPPGQTGELKAVEP